jgi:hypothetical protein
MYVSIQLNHSQISVCVCLDRLRNRLGPCCSEMLTKITDPRRSSERLCFDVTAAFHRRLMFPSLHKMPQIPQSVSITYRNHRSLRKTSTPDTQAQPASMPPRTLKELPIHLRRFAAHKAYKVPKEDNECMVCMRAFNTKDDVFNLSETPCRPYRLQPCNHLIGSECLKEMLRRGSTFCPYCTVRLGTVNPVPRWIMYLLKDKCLISPAFWLPRAQQHATSQGRAELESFEALQDHLFKGTLPVSGGVQL